MYWRRVEVLRLWIGLTVCQNGIGNRWVAIFRRRIRPCRGVEVRPHNRGGASAYWDMTAGDPIRWLTIAGFRETDSSNNNLPQAQRGCMCLTIRPWKWMIVPISRSPTCPRTSLSIFTPPMSVVAQGWDGEWATESVSEDNSSPWEKSNSSSTIDSDET